MLNEITNNQYFAKLIGGLDNFESSKYSHNLEG